MEFPPAFLPPRLFWLDLGCTVESLAAWFQETLLPFGDWGILLLAALDASFVPMPGFIDLAVMGACALQPERAWSFGTAAIVGSTAGTMVIYGIARAGRAATRLSPRRLAWAERFLGRRGAFALLLAAVLPAPFPFKVVVTAAGYLRQPFPGALVGVGLGRLLRFGTQATLAALYGQAIIAQAEAHAPVAGLMVVSAFLIAGILYYRWRAATAD